jgi:transcriptional regulator with XRE-family HTH domain
MGKREEIDIFEILGLLPKPTPRRAPAQWLNAARIRAAREARRLTQGQLALLVGLARTQMADLELNGRVPAGHPDIVERLAAVLRIDADTIRTRYDRQRIATGGEG